MLPEKSSAPKSQDNNNIKQKAWHQQHRFALISSYCYLIFTGLSTTIGFIGVGLVLHGNITIGALTSIGSLLATKELRKISAEANFRVDSFACTGGDRLLQCDQKNEE
jgi:hypothetical protein